MAVFFGIQLNIRFIPNRFFFHLKENFIVAI